MIIGYHGTDAAEQFDTFDLGRSIDIGIHFGLTRQPALERIAQACDPRCSRIMECQLRVEESDLVRVDDGFTWSPETCLMLLRESGVISDEEYQFATDELLVIDSDYMQDKLGAKGYLGLVYDNKVEGGESVCLFDPTLIRIVSVQEFASPSRSED
jgi:hypothetical protein